MCYRFSITLVFHCSFVISYQTSHHFFNQSEVKPSKTRSQSFPALVDSCLHLLQVLVSSLDIQSTFRFQWLVHPIVCVCGVCYQENPDSGSRVFRAFHWKIPGNRWDFEKVVLFSHWKLSDRNACSVYEFYFSRNRQFQAIQTISVPPSWILVTSA